MKRLMVVVAMVAGSVLLAPVAAHAAPTAVQYKNCYGGAPCSNADFIVQDDVLACSRTSGFLGIEYHAATTPAPTTTDQVNAYFAWRYANDAFQRNPNPGSSAFATWLQDVYLSVDTVTSHWELYSQAPGQYGQIPLNTERRDADAVCQVVD